MSERLATLHALQRKREGPQLLVTTVNAATQRMLTPFRVRQLTRRLAPGERIERDALVALLTANGYQRTDTVHDAGEYAVRGALVDLFPAGETERAPARFLRRRDRERCAASIPPTSARPARPTRFTLLPASEALLDEDSIKRFRAALSREVRRHRDRRPALPGVSEGRRLAGMEHWLPLFEERLATLFDHLGEDDVIVRDAGADGALDARFEAIADYYANRDRAMVAEPGSYRPLAPDDALSRARGMGRGGRRAAAPPRLALPRAAKATRVIDFEVEAARDFAPERAQNANVYEAVVEHVAKLRKASRRSCSPAIRRRARAAGGPARRPWPEVARSWPTAGRRRWARKADAALIVLPLDHGFTTPDVAVLTEQDMLGDRLVRRRKRTQERRRLPQPSWRRSRPATSSSTPITASAATRG